MRAFLALLLDLINESLMRGILVKKFNCVVSGEHAGHSIAPYRPIQHLGNRSF